MKDPVISHAKHFSDADSKGKPKQKPCPAAKDRKLPLEGALLLVKVFRNLLQGKGIFVFFCIWPCNAYGTGKLGEVIPYAAA